jgi:hypothetical protein
VRKTSIPAAPGEPAPPAVYGGSRWKRIAISAFVLFHLVAISAWCLPVNSLLNDRFKQTIRPYILWTGLFAAWDMFAPDPVKLNSYVDAEVTFRDGSTRQNLIPRMDRIGFVDRYFRERYRKFATEYVRMDSYSVMWPDVARYFARMQSTPANPVTEVRLTRSWSEINPPGPAGLYQPSPWSHFTFFTYQPKPEDLR